MNMSFIEKIFSIFKYIGSSFLSIELFLLSLLLFLLLIFNIKEKNKYVNFIVIIVFIFLLGFVTIGGGSYVKYCVDSLIEFIMRYIYFPSTVVYFFIVLICVFLCIYTMFSNKLSNFKKVFNYSVFSFIIFFFLSFVAVTTSRGLDLSILEELYKDNLVLSIVQISNLLLFGWCLFTFFYNLYIFFKRKFD